MSLPWGVKEAVNPEQADAVTEFTSTITDKSFDLPSGNVITVLKAELKERKGKYLWIMRYEITNLA